MSYQPFELYLFEKASQLTSKRYGFVDKVKKILSKKGDPKICMENGLRFLEFNCSLLYGYTSECIETGDKVMKNIPVIFDSALILSLILDTEINAEIISNLQLLLKSNQSKSGFWTYFLHNKSLEYDILPDDIDDTSSVLMSLFLSNAVSREECVCAAEKMKKHFLYDMDGLISTYLKPTSESGNVLWKHYTESARVDLGSCLNCLWFFGSLGLDHILKGEKFQPTIKLLTGALQQIESDENVITHTISYSNPNILLFFLSRFVMVSKFGEMVFRDKLIEIIMKKMESDYKNTKETCKNGNRNETVIDFACQIMVAINMNLHKYQEYSKVQAYISLKMRNILSLQLPDGSFPRAPIYDWKPYKAVTASKAISTAFAVAAVKMVIDLEYSCFED